MRIIRLAIRNWKLEIGNDPVKGNPEGEK